MKDGRKRARPRAAESAAASSSSAQRSTNETLQPSGEAPSNSLQLDSEEPASGMFDERDTDERLDDSASMDNEADHEMDERVEDEDDDEIIDEEEQEEGEDLYNDNMMEDYRAVEELDRYEIDAEAEADDASLSIGARRTANDAMRRRDREEARTRGDAHSTRLPAALRAHFNDASDDDDTARNNDEEEQRRRRRRLADFAAAAHADNCGRSSQSRGSNAGSTAATPSDVDGHLHSSGPADDGFDIESYRGPLKEWIVMERPRIELRRRFAHFLRSATDDKTGSAVYVELVRNMCANNQQSLVVSYRHLSSVDPLLAVWVADAPSEMLSIFDGVARELTLQHFPNYRSIHNDIFVRIAELPIVDELRDIRHIHLNCLVKVCGVVTRRTGVFPHMKVVKLDCQRCGSVLTPSGSTAARPERAISQCPECGSRGPFTVNSEQTVFGNFQRLTIQESPGSVPPGRLPRQKDVVLTADLIDVARPGDEVEVTGIYRHSHDVSLNIRHGFPVFQTIIEANFIRKVEDTNGYQELTDDDVAELRQLAEDPHIGERVVRSIAPSIHGHRNIKTAIALSLFGGQPKEIGERHRIRGDINVLLLGDPGTAKSQFLKYVEKTASRAVYTTGKGASAVGLTAAVHRDSVTHEWVLEGGALVLADRGVCLIDEFDKMNEQDRTSIHEAMEQQTISISKAGIITSLQARCAVIAAANPVKGRYDASINFADNVDLTEPILSRFDVLCVVRDVVDPLADETLARYVVNSHVAAHPAQSEHEQSQLQRLNSQVTADGVKLIPQLLLRKYLVFARRNVHPRVSNVDQEKISRLYIDLRRESLANGGMPIALRHLESIVRMAEAHARMHLRGFVRDDDVNVAISVMLDSFFQSQKYSVMRGLRRTFNKYLTTSSNSSELLFYLLSRLVRDYLTAQGSATGDPDAALSVQIDLDDFDARARELGVHHTRDLLNSAAFRERGFVFDERNRRIIKQV